MSWMGKAACRGKDGELWFALPGTVGEREARARCASCPVRRECLDEALAEGMDHGIWGGLDPEERRVEARRRAVTPV